MSERKFKLLDNIEPYAYPLSAVFVLIAIFYGFSNYNLTQLEYAPLSYYGTLAQTKFVFNLSLIITSIFSAFFARYIIRKLELGSELITLILSVSVIGLLGIPLFPVPLQTQEPNFANFIHNFFARVGVLGFSTALLLIYWKIIIKDFVKLGSIKSKYANKYIIASFILSVLTVLVAFIFVATKQNFMYQQLSILLVGGSAVFLFWLGLLKIK